MPQERQVGKSGRVLWKDGLKGVQWVYWRAKYVNYVYVEVCFMAIPEGEEKGFKNIHI